MATIGETPQNSGAFFSASTTRRLVPAGSTHTLTRWRPRAPRSAHTLRYGATLVKGRSSRIISRLSFSGSTYSVQARSVTIAYAVTTGV
ncbi:MAG: hypothetical protein IPH48_18830 [bacterium]|nr:hypothetical protein [bacterium]